jgi:hypothetical protein
MQRPIRILAKAAMREKREEAAVCGGRRSGANAKPVKRKAKS